MGPSSKAAAPDRLIQFCGANCRQCDTYRGFLGGNERGLVNPETGYRCCWLPADHGWWASLGRDCPIKTCCERRAILFCGECEQFSDCDRMEAFYAQPGYEALRRRMFDALRKLTEGAEGPVLGDDVS